jgi:ABC-2 type transport system ATP-binding protein
LPEVQAVCDRVQIINQGKTVFSDTFDQLAKKQQASSVIIGFDNDIDQKHLDKIANVDSVEVLGANRYKLAYAIDSGDTPNTNELVLLSQKQGWHLNELTPEVNTLEQIFMNLIHSDIGAVSKTDEAA